MKTCPCALHVRLNYADHDPDQARIALALIEELGEWMTVTVAGVSYRVSRHCIAIHGVVATQIADYGFDRVEKEVKSHGPTDH